MKAKKKFWKYEEIWRKVRDLIKSITENSGDYDERYMKIKFNSDEKLPLNKTREIPSMLIFARGGFHENSNYLSQVFLDQCLHKI